MTLIQFLVQFQSNYQTIVALSDLLVRKQTLLKILHDALHAGHDLSDISHKSLKKLIPYPHGFAVLNQKPSGSERYDHFYVKHKQLYLRPAYHRSEAILNHLQKFDVLALDQNQLKLRVIFEVPFQSKRLKKFSDVIFYIRTRDQRILKMLRK